jgi:hypothetical protein
MQHTERAHPKLRSVENTYAPNVLCTIGHLCVAHAGDRASSRLQYTCLTDEPSCSLSFCLTLVNR